MYGWQTTLLVTGAASVTDWRATVGTQASAVMSSSINEARATLQVMVRRLGYPHQTEALIVSQLLDTWRYYRLRPVVLPNPQPLVVGPTGVAPPPQQIICMTGNLSILVSSRHYPIPLRVYVLMPFPHVNPLVYVAPYEGAVVPPNHPFVNSQSGLVDLTSPNMSQGIWRPTENSIPQLLRRLQEGFGMRPPLIEDPEYAEKREKAAKLSHMMQSRLQQETQRGQSEFVDTVRHLKLLRRKNIELSDERDKWAAQVGSGASKELALTRERLLRIEAQLREYGVEAGSGTGTAVVVMSSDVKGAPPVVVGEGAGGIGADIQLEELLMISSGHPLRDQHDDLMVEEKAVEDALDEAEQAMRRKQVTLEEFLRKTKELATQQCQIKTRLIKLGKEMDAAVEADAQREALDARGASDRAVSGLGGGPGPGGGAAGNGGMAGVLRSRSRLLTSGMLPLSHMPVHRGGPGRPPPPPGPPPLGQARSRLSFAS